MASEVAPALAAEPITDQGEEANTLPVQSEEKAPADSTTKPLTFKQRFRRVVKRFESVKAEQSSLRGEKKQCRKKERDLQREVHYILDTLLELEGDKLGFVMGDLSSAVDGAYAEDEMMEPSFVVEPEIRLAEMLKEHQPTVFEPPSLELPERRKRTYKRSRPTNRRRKEGHPPLKRKRLSADDELSNGSGYDMQSGKSDQGSYYESSALSGPEYGMDHVAPAHSEALDKVPGQVRYQYENDFKRASDVSKQIEPPIQTVAHAQPANTASALSSQTEITASKHVAPPTQNLTSAHVPAPTQKIVPTQSTVPPPARPSAYSMSHLLSPSTQARHDHSRPVYSHEPGQSLPEQTSKPLQAPKATVEEDLFDILDVAPRAPSQSAGPLRTEAKSDSHYEQPPVAQRSKMSVADLVHEHSSPIRREYAPTPIRQQDSGNY